MGFVPERDGCASSQVPKKTDFVRHLKKVLNEVGLLVNGPPGMAGLSFI
jgi:hypothetical protein